ncbi:UDP-glucose/GDP-mannose dehydrogenase family protein [Lysinibacillus sp. Ag94]|uniref:UDP-glucose dehydrogenase family protein n=1 Tax=Lysinibacillus sp. Ag94 TaxID=2936682 RepID=UPI002010564E|nr:nucleotide sugar dehydrogenase [Lysinibacillus sp. Ag94]UPW84744.1 nucleotide sugar dehydrogenase [Lysinibacillus sp. Ag94]
MRIAVFGLGFVGLTTALGFADKGFSVYGYDINKEHCAVISGGKVPFFEPGLDDALARNLGTAFTLVDSAIEAAYKSDICFFCVGTPSLPDGSADLEHLLFAIDSVLETVSQVCVLVVKSTVPPGTLSERVTPHVRAKGANNPVVVNPEFLREGSCWEDFINADRIVCGVTDDIAKSVLAELYMPFGAPLHFVEPNTAEFIKYLSNSLLAALISYSNEMALLADAVGGIETARAFRILHEDSRFAGAEISSYIYPGCGYGGYCLPKDTAALDAVALGRGFTPRILESVISLNNEMPDLTARKIAHAAGKKTEKIGILGLSFKPGSDDVRDSPAVKIIKTLIRDGYVNIYTYDPLAMQKFQNIYRLPITYCESLHEVCKTCRTVALVTAWEEFKGIDKTFPDTHFVDCRYFLEN